MKNKKFKHTCPICDSDCKVRTYYDVGCTGEEYVECVHGHWKSEYSYGNSVELFYLPNGFYEDVGWTYMDRGVKVPYEKWRNEYKKFCRKHGKRWNRRKIVEKDGWQL